MGSQGGEIGKAAGGTARVVGRKAIKMTQETIEHAGLHIRVVPKNGKYEARIQSPDQRPLTMGTSVGGAYGPTRAYDTAREAIDAAKAMIDKAEVRFLHH